MPLNRHAGPLMAAGILAASLLHASGSYDPNAPRWIAIALAAGLGWSVAAAGFRHFDRLDRASLALVGYALASLAWSPDPAQGAVSTLALFGAVGIFAGARRIDARALDPWLPLACQTGLAATLLLHFGGLARGGGMGNENFLAESLVALLPFAALGFFRPGPVVRRLAWLPFPLAAVVTLAFLLPTKAGVLALGAVGCLAIVQGWGRIGKVRPAWRAVAALCVVVVAIAAVLWRGADAFAASLAARVELAVNTLHLWRDHPLSGVGMGGFEPLYPAYQERHFALLGDSAGLLTIKSLRAGAAHCEPIQFLATFGLLGLAVPLLVLWRHKVPAALSTAASAEKRAALATVGGLLAIGLVGFPFQLPLTLLLFAVALGRVLARAPDPAAGTAGLRALPIAAAALTLPFLVVATLQTIGQMRLGEAFRALGPDPRFAEEQHARALAIAPWDYSIRANRFVSFARLAEAAPSAPADLAVADRLYSVSVGSGIAEMQAAMARAEFLQNIENLPPAYAQEVVAIVADLTGRATLVPETWILAGAVALRRGDAAAALASVAQGRRLRARFNSRRLDPALARGDQIELLDVIEKLAKAMQPGAPPPRLILSLGFTIF
ncbi:MAG: hypothetical protein HY059_17650 [Proteobacteria bacterium]|nr:hypothetical protein [Pseudomonadota bacterium]